MSGNWTIAVYILLPVPLVALVLLSLPLPQKWNSTIRKYLVPLLETCLFSKIYKDLNLYQMATIVSFVLLLLTSFESFKASQKRDVIRDLREERLLCQKWRSERNFWISFLSFVLWLILQRMYTVIKELEILRPKVREHAE